MEAITQPERAGVRVLGEQRQDSPAAGVSEALTSRCGPVNPGYPNFVMPRMRLISILAAMAILLNEIVRRAEIHYSRWRSD